MELIHRAEECTTGEKLRLAEAEELLKQAYQRIKSMEEDYAVLMTPELKSERFVQIQHRLDNIRSARELLRSVGEAYTYLKDDSRSRHAQQLLTTVLSYPDENQVIRRIKDQAEAVLARKRFEEGRYEVLVRVYLDKIERNPEDAAACKGFAWAESMERLDKEWTDIHQREKEAIESITGKLGSDYKNVQSSVRVWERISIVAAITALIFAVGVGVWMIQQQYPAAYITGVVPVLVAVVEPLILRHYVKILEQRQQENKDLTTQLMEYEMNSQETIPSPITAKHGPC